MSYVQLQEDFLKALFLREKAKFKNILFEVLFFDKNFRKKRFVLETNQNKFPVSDLIHLDIYQKALDNLFSLDVEDRLLIEKSYYLLNNIVSFAKREGLEEIKKVIEFDKNLSYLFLNQNPSDWILIKESHLNHDLDMEYFEKNLLEVKEYCQNYRDEAYVLHEELLKKYKVLKNLELI